MERVNSLAPLPPFWRLLGWLAALCGLALLVYLVVVLPGQQVKEEAYSLASREMGQRLINHDRQPGEHSRLDITFVHSDVNGMCRFEGDLRDGRGTQHHQFDFSIQAPCLDLDMEDFLDVLSRNVPENMRWIIDRLRDIQSRSHWWDLFRGQARG